MTQDEAGFCGDVGQDVLAACEEIEKSEDQSVVNVSWVIETEFGFFRVTVDRDPMAGWGTF